MTSDFSNELEFTGERFTPECVREIWYEHIHRYVLAAELARDRNVLDAACGEGYGTQLLAGTAAAVTGVDIAPEVIAHASTRYRSGNLSYQVADCRALPFRDGQFNCIVSFETVEHMADQEQLLREFRRVLSADGFLLISTPDKAVYTDQLENDNPHHVRELYRGEFEALLAREFPAVRMFGHKLAFHSMIWPEDSERNGVADSAMQVVLHREDKGASLPHPGRPADPLYLIALCAGAQDLLPRLADCLWLFDDASESVYRHYRHEIRKNMQAGAIIEQRDQEIETLKAALLQTSQPQASHTQVAEPRSWWRRVLGRS